MHSVEFFVYGHPEHQGNHVPAFGGRGIRDKNDKKLKPWRHAIAAVATLKMQEYGREPLTGAVGIQLTFYLQRPRHHYGQGRNSEILRRDAPMFKETRPDMDKLERAVLDALTGVCYEDDARVVDKHTLKLYANDHLRQLEGVWIRVHPVPEAGPDTWLRPTQ